MKYIDKGHTPPRMQKWLEQWKTSNVGKLPLFDDFTKAQRGALKKEVKGTILAEQGCICCYCMKSIDYYSSHFEHFDPRCLYHDEEVDYSNLFLSCEGEHYDESHCGRPKDREDTPMLVYPADPAVEQNFQYGQHGEIFSNTAKGMTSLRVLGLKSLALQRHRAEALDAAGFYDVDFDEIKEEIREEYLHRTAGGEYMPFCTAVLYCIDHFT